MAHNLVIKTAEDIHGMEPRWHGTTAVERGVLKHFHMETSGFNVTLPTATSNKATGYARVDAGRWIVDCPWCKSAAFASREDRRFFCVECANTAVHGAWINVVFPGEWAEIEALLSVRPHAMNQWWTPGEKLSQLQAENIEHGLPA